jgi:pectate lyase
MPAFPGAEGYGCQATGGRGGSVYKVTNLLNSGAGSFRSAFSGANYRTILFDTGGTVPLTTRLNASPLNTTVAGQTAPGGGFCVKNGDMWFSNANNLIVRYVRFRLGRNAGTDSSGNYFDTFTLTNCVNAIVDHCSTSWSGDECLSVTNPSNNITVQWCLISEGLNWNGHGYGSLISSDAVNGQQSWHHNLYAHQAGRNPRAGSRNNQSFLLDFVNNVIYNWGHTSGDFGAWAAYYTGEKIDLNWVGNYSIAGLDSTGKTTVMLSSNMSTSRIYIGSDNLIDSDRDTVRNGTTATWTNVPGTKTQMTSAFTIPSWAAITTDTADTAYTNVLAGAGATKPSRDSVDTRVINDVINMTGNIINTPDDVGGWPTLDAGTAPTDTDGDGMPDAWETAYGTNPNVPDNYLDLDGDGYTNLEEYINSL